MNAEELRWRTEDDARTLKAYAQLQKEPARLAAAQKLLEEELKLAAEAMGLKDAIAEKLNKLM